MKLFAVGLIAGLILLSISMVQAQVCDIDVYNLHIESNQISAFIKNNASYAQTAVWRILIDNTQRFSDSLSLSAGQSQMVSRGWTFDTGTHNVTFEAGSACLDSEEATHIVLPLYTEPSPEAPSQPTPFCNLSITSFDYLSTTNIGSQAYAAVGVQNMALPATITLRLFIDGRLNQTQSVWLDAGRSTGRTFYFNLTTGNHTIEVRADASCGAGYVISGNVLVQPATYIVVNQTVPSGLPAPTSATVTPSSLEIPVNSSESLAINIRSASPQNFTVNVSGVPEDWLSYKNESSVEERATMYVDVNPKEVGSYMLFITAKAKSENLTFNFAVSLYSGTPAVSSDMLQRFVSDVQSLIKFYQENPLWLAVTIGIIVVIVLAAGIAILREEGFLLK